MGKAIMSALAGLALLGCSAEHGNDVTAVQAASTDWNGQQISVSDGFVRPVGLGGAATAGYMTVKSSAGDRLISADAPGFSAVELHQVDEQDGVSRMRRVDAVDLPADVAVKLEPGGYHLMMMGPETALYEGDIVPVTLSFESGAVMVVDTPVATRGPAAMDHSGH